MESNAAQKDPAALGAELQATIDRLQRRTRRLSGRAAALHESAQRLRASTERLRVRLQSSFPPPPFEDAEPDQG